MYFTAYYRVFLYFSSLFFLFISLDHSPHFFLSRFKDVFLFLFLHLPHNAFFFTISSSFQCSSISFTFSSELSLPRFLFNIASLFLLFSFLLNFLSFPPTPALVLHTALYFLLSRSLFLSIFLPSFSSHLFSSPIPPPPPSLLLPPPPPPPSPPAPQVYLALPPSFTQHRPSLYR